MSQNFQENSEKNLEYRETFQKLINLQILFENLTTLISEIFVCKSILECCGTADFDYLHNAGDSINSVLINWVPEAWISDAGCQISGVECRDGESRAGYLVAHASCGMPDAECEMIEHRQLDVDCGTLDARYYKCQFSKYRMLHSHFHLEKRNTKRYRFPQLLHSIVSISLPPYVVPILRTVFRSWISQRFVNIRLMRNLTSTSIQ